jgi:hypothetical protein
VISCKYLFSLKMRYVNDISKVPPLIPNISYRDMNSNKLIDIKFELEISIRNRLKDIHSVFQHAILSDQVIPLI